MLWVVRQDLAVEASEFFDDFLVNFHGIFTLVRRLRPLGKKPPPLNLGLFQKHYPLPFLRMCKTLFSAVLYFLSIFFKFYFKFTHLKPSIATFSVNRNSSFCLCFVGITL